MTSLAYPPLGGKGPASPASARSWCRHGRLIRDVTRQISWHTTCSGVRRLRWIGLAGLVTAGVLALCGWSPNPEVTLTAPAPGHTTGVRPYTISLPLYPGATPYRGAQPLGGPIEGVPASNDTEMVGATYALPAGARGVQSWYLRTMKGLGYTTRGPSPFYAPRWPVLAATTTAFTNPKVANLSVEIDFPTPKDGSAVMEYWVVYVATPRRPPASRLPRNIRRVVIVATPPPPRYTAPTSPLMTATVTDPTAIRHLEGDVNGLSMSSGLLIACPQLTPAEMAAGARLTFETGAGESLPVVVQDVYCGPEAVVKGQYMLSMPASSHLWGDLLEAVGYRGPLRP